MAHKNKEHTFLPIKDMVAKYKFLTHSSLRGLIYKNKAFEKKCVRRLVGKVLIIEEKFLEFIENSGRSSN